VLGSLASSSRSAERRPRSDCQNVVAERVVEIAAGHDNRKELVHGTQEGAVAAADVEDRSGRGEVADRRRKSAISSERGPNCSDCTAVGARCCSMPCCQRKYPRFKLCA